MSCVVIKTAHAHGKRRDSDSSKVVCTYLRKHFDPNWPGVETWLDRVTPAYNRLVNAIWAM